MKKKINYKKPFERLENGETFIHSESGNSMIPLIKSKQRVVLSPTKWEDVEIDDIVYAKVSGKFFLHKVSAKNNNRGVQISNNKGHVNGWTKHVYGKVIKILKDGEEWP
jgi:phage repressor protein C with HTH and peptisase S24 domain